MIENQFKDAAREAGIETPRVTFTLFKSRTPLSKEFWTAGDDIHKAASAQMTRGQAVRTSTEFAKFGDVLRRATPNQAVCFGVHGLHLPDSVEIVTSGALPKDAAHVIARTKEYLHYSVGAGILMIDHDPSPYGKHYTPVELLAALCDIHPEIAKAARFVRGSVSAGVHRPNEAPRTDKGFHIYIPVADAGDIPRYGAVLFKRLWLVGCGFIALGRNGAMLGRSPIDGAVFSPERLDFIAPPIIRAGADLVYTPPALEYTEGRLLDTSTLSDLSADESADYARRVDDAKATIQPRAVAMREEWAAGHIAERVARGVPETKARADVERLCSGGSVDLDADFVLHFATAGSVTVRDVLSAPKRFDGQALADPVEGVDYGRTTAKFYLNDGKAVLNSNAHGGCKYFLHGDVTESGQSDDRHLLATTKIASDKTDNDAEHFAPRADENPVIAALRANGLYGRPSGGGKHDIACAFTGDAATRATYYEPTPSHPRGGYFCVCKTCHRKHRIGDLLAHLGIGKAEAMHKPTFRAVGGELHAIVNQAEKELAQSRLFFQQGGMIVKVITDEHGVTKVCAVNKVALNYEFNGRFTWEKFDKRSSEWFVIDAPTAYAHTLFDLMNYEHLPPILSVARQPFFRDDNTLCEHSGYDEASRIYAIFDETAFRVDGAASTTAVETAKSSLLGLLDGFEFAAETDRAAALCALLTAAVRATLPTAPGILATAHSPGSGKSYLLDMAALFASDLTAAAASFLIDDDEMRKQLIAALIESPAAVKFDEMKSDLLPIKTLLSCLSAEQIEGRILGASKIVRPSTRSLMLFAGNNVQAVQDMCRRILTIHLDVQCESPATREFSGDPLGQLKANRASYVSSALMLIAWAQKQAVTLSKRLNGFGRWEQLCRRTVIALGLPDPCENIFAQLDHDPDREQLAAVLDAVNTEHGAYSFKVRDLVDRTPANSDLYELLQDVSHSKGDGIDNRMLSRWIRRNVGKVANGRRFEEDKRFSGNVTKYRVLTLQGSAPKPSDLSDLPDSNCESFSSNRLSRINRVIPAPTPKLSEGEI